MNSTSGANANVEILARAADNLYRKKQLDDALAAYEKAGQAAQAVGDVKRAFELRYKAGLIDHVREQREPAARRLRMVSRELSMATERMAR